MFGRAVPWATPYPYISGYSSIKLKLKQTNFSIALVAVSFVTTASVVVGAALLIAIAIIRYTPDWILTQQEIDTIVIILLRVAVQIFRLQLAFLRHEVTPATWSWGEIVG